MSDDLYTDEDVLALADVLWSRGAFNHHDEAVRGARDAFAHLAAAGKLIPRRAQEDLRWHARAYLYTRPDGKQLVLDPQHVTVVLPQEAP